MALLVSWCHKLLANEKCKSDFSNAQHFSRFLFYPLYSTLTHPTVGVVTTSARVIPLVCIMEHRSIIKLDKYLNFGDVPLGMQRVGSIELTNVSSTDKLHFLSMFSPAAAAASRGRVTLSNAHTGADFRSIWYRGFRSRQGRNGFGRYEWGYLCDLGASKCSSRVRRG